ncbi:MAG: U32 family peptidase [Pirellulales bacterium]|nr:U32 family peptidase [Pirellulales bacterium]
MNKDPRSENHPKIELLAPAGDWPCVRAAIENGADAVYFGLDCGFNARYRAKNFHVDELSELTGYLRQRRVRGYVTLNTLVFPEELGKLVATIESIARSGIDAVLVQDFGVARLVAEVCPDLEIHASTQMSLTSAETIAVARQLGLARVVLARELSVAEVRKIAAATDMPLEVFIHGALCVAYSGQCLTSESLGGRSANRGQCAQACRLPYELVCDGEDRDLGDQQYLLSPQDLAGYAAIVELIDAGVASLKIEGRLKTAEYVANITQHYRRAIDEAYASGRVSIDEQDRREMELSFSRGFTPGWLRGNDHKRLVPGLHSAKRGIELGTILEIDPPRIKIWLDAPLALGDGLAIDGVDGRKGQGGRIYSLDDHNGQPQKELEAGQTGWIGFGRDEIDWNQVTLDAAVFKNDDPKLNRRLRQTFSSPDPQYRRPLTLTVIAVTGTPLRLVGRLPGGVEVEVVGTQKLEAATKHPAEEEMLREKLGRLGGTPFQLGQFHAEIQAAPLVPMGMLNQMRRDLVDQLLSRLSSPPPRSIDRQAGYRLLETPVPADETERHGQTTPRLAVLCRTLAQFDTVARAETKPALIYADFHDIREYREAIRIAQQRSVPVGLASVRMQKPGEMGLLRAIGKRRPDWGLARNLAAVDYFRDQNLPTIGDFSLNVANHLSAQWLRSLGPRRVTASYDLNRDQLLGLVDTMPAEALEVVIHQHMPMFHMEHCVFCSVLSPGTNKTNCGRPCDRHVVQLRDRVGAEHKLEADVACRNTLYNETPQSGAESVEPLRSRGVNWFRIELLAQNETETQFTLSVYRRLLAGELSGREVWQTLQASNRMGVTRGTLEAKRDPLAIL